MKKTGGAEGPQGKRGRKPERDIRTKDRLVAEVKAEIAALDPEHKLKKPPVEQAIASCLRHDAPPSPGHGGGKGAPLGQNSAMALYYKAAADLEEAAARSNHGVLPRFPTWETVRN